MPNSELKGLNFLGISFEEHLARTNGDSCWPAASATPGAEVAEAGRRSGFAGLQLLDETSGPGASGSGHGNAYDNILTASVAKQIGNMDPA